MDYLAYPLDGHTLDASLTMYPTTARVTRTKEHRCLGDRRDTVYGYVLDGRFRVISRAMGKVDLVSGQWFALPGPVDVETVESGMLSTVTRHGYRAPPQIGAREEKGRLSYIDGCSDSMLSQPARLGDPCYNHLHFPSGVIQTQHTHPSIRLGTVIAGSGLAWRGKHGDKRDLAPAIEALANGATLEGALARCDTVDWAIELKAGGVFMLHEQELHSFATVSDTMDIIAYHPDSDWGPTDDLHPMLNRTHVRHGGGQ